MWDSTLLDLGETLAKAAGNETSQQDLLAMDDAKWQARERGSWAT
jgi:hypothetical protein